MTRQARATQALSVVMVALGIALLVRTAQAGGGIGYLFGSLLLLAGALRLVLLRARRSPSDARDS